MELEEIRRHWEVSGKQLSINDKISPTTRDPYLGKLEEDNILAYLKSNTMVLEIGCGDAIHTIEYAKRVSRIVGIDIADSLIKKATKIAKSTGIRNIDFIAGSVLNLKKLLGTLEFDYAISQRCLINLPDWRKQQDVILQIHSILNTDGFFLLTEGFQDELDGLNQIRVNLGLTEIRVVNYNRNIYRSEFETFISKYFKIIEVRHYGAYLFLSRVFHPLAVLPNSPKHDSRLNMVAMEISRLILMPDLEKYSYNLFYALQKL